MKKFFNLYLADKAKADQIDDFIAEWHTGAGHFLPLNEFLGMTDEEFAAWVEYPEILPELREKRREA